MRRSCGEGWRSYLGRSRLAPERATRPTAEREVSRGHSSAHRRRAEQRGGRNGPSLEGEWPQMSRQLELPRRSRGEAPRAPTVRGSADGGERQRAPGSSALMERVFAPANLQAALARVRRNKGSPGVDGMKVEELPGTYGSTGRRSGATARGDVPAAAGEAGGDSQAGRREATTGHPDRPGSLHPAGRAAGAAAGNSTRLLSAQLRFPARPKRPRSGASGATSTSRRAAAGWWTWTWRSSSTG